MTKIPKLGLVGCGNWGKNILRDLNSLGCETWVVDIAEAGRKNATDGGAAGVSSRLDELPEIDGALVATPASTHADIIDALLDRPIPVFTEKPMSDNLERARELARRGGDRLFVMHKWRYHPAIEAMAEIVRTEELGPVVGLHTRRLGCGNPHHDVDSVWILLPHDLTIGLEVLGHVPKPQAAVADMVDSYGYGMSALLGRFPWQTIEVSTRHPGVRREMRLHCRDGVVRLADSYDDHLQIFRFVDRHSPHPPEPERRPISTEFPLLRELRTFVEYLQGGPAPRSSAAEAIRVVETIAELRRMAELPDTFPGAEVSVASSAATS